MSPDRLIEPRTLKGFRDFLPEVMIPRERLIETARGVFRSYGFSPIDTPALEHLDVLLGKGSEETDKQLYRFVDAGGRAVGMRFDLTVPLARFAAQHAAQLAIPFKRYHIATVWRGENTQRGRYREFMQCDFDTVGTRALAADVETVLVIHDLLAKIGFERFTIHLNERRVLGGMLQRLGLLDHAAAVLRVLDKLAKIGPHRVAQEMVAVAGIAESQAHEILKLANLTGGNQAVLADLEPLVGDNQTGRVGLENLRAAVAAVAAAGVPAARVKVDVAIARGLDYYTGMVYETLLDDLPAIGSVCSGGRYDNLAGMFTRQELPGVGASLGLDRLLAAMQELGMHEKLATPAPVLVVQFAAEQLHDYLWLAAQVRSAGIGVEVFPEAKKLAQQLKYADRRGFRLALIAGPDERAAGTCQLKDLAHEKSIAVPVAWDDRTAAPAELLAALRQRLE